MRRRRELPMNGENMSTQEKNQEPRKPDQERPKAGVYLSSDPDEVWAESCLAGIKAGAKLKQERGARAAREAKQE